MEPDSTTAPRVTVIVLSWNRRDDLRACLDALRRQTYANRDVVVVDNGSSDGSAEMLRRDYPDVRLLRSEQNLGFAAGNNLAIRATDSPYVATLNNDAIPAPDWLEVLVATAEADASLGSVASKMVFQQDPSTINSCGIALDRAGIAWDLLGGYPAALVARPREVFGPCAGAALYRRAMLDDVGLFDEDFFAYLEDVDLAWRARLRGWGSVLAPDALVRHAHSGTLGEGSPLKRYLLARNKIWTIAKCDDASPLDLALTALYDLGAVSFAVARHRDGASLRGRLAGLAGLRGALRKRAAIQTARLVDHRTVSRLYAPLAAPWNVPRRYRHLVRSLGPRASGRAGAEGDRLAARGLGPGTNDRVAVAPPRAEAKPPLRHLLRRAGLRALAAVLARSRRPRRPGADPWPPGPGPRPATRVVVLRPDHLGDVLLSRPAIEALVDHGLDVTVVAGPSAAASLQGLPVRVVAFPFPGFTRSGKRGLLAPYSALLAFAARLRCEGYAAALVLRPDHWWGALAAVLAGIPIRVGHATPETAPFLTHRLFPHTAEHATYATLRAAAGLADALGLEPLRLAGRSVRYEPSAAAHAVADGWIAEHLSNRRPVVMLHPGAGAAVKTWPARRWASIARALTAEAQVLLTGGPTEADMIEAIQATLERRLPAAADFTWDQLAALYRRADVVLGMDSGPLHLAAAVGTPTVRIYGPTDPRIYGPPGRHGACTDGILSSEGLRGDEGPAGDDTILQATLPCVPCGNLVSPPCGYLQDPPCLASVSSEDVVAAVRALLPLAAPA